MTIIKKTKQVRSEEDSAWKEVMVASVILMQLAAIEAKNKPDEERKQVKLALTKRLYEKGFDRKAVINFYRFIDWLIGLPKPLELEYLNDVHKLEELNKMAYISSVERFGMEKGIEQVARHMLE